MPVTYLLLVLEFGDVKPIYRKSWVGGPLVFFRFDLVPLFQGQMRRVKLKSAYNLLINGSSDMGCETNLYKIMGWESFGVVRFDLGAFLQGQMRIAKPRIVFLTNLLLVLDILDGKATYRKSWAGNLLMSDLTLDPPSRSNEVGQT